MRGIGGARGEDELLAQVCADVAQDRTLAAHFHDDDESEGKVNEVLGAGQPHFDQIAVARVAFNAAVATAHATKRREIARAEDSARRDIEAADAVFTQTVTDPGLRARASGAEAASTAKGVSRCKLAVGFMLLLVTKHLKRTWKTLVESHDPSDDQLTERQRTWLPHGRMLLGLNLHNAGGLKNQWRQWMHACTVIRHAARTAGDAALVKDLLGQGLPVGTRKFRREMLIWPANGLLVRDCKWLCNSLRKSMQCTNLLTMDTLRERRMSFHPRTAALPILVNAHAESMQASKQIASLKAKLLGRPRVYASRAPADIAGKLDEVALAVEALRKTLTDVAASLAEGERVGNAEDLGSDDENND